MKNRNRKLRKIKHNETTIKWYLNKDSRTVVAFLPGLRAETTYAEINSYCQCMDNINGDGITPGKVLFWLKCIGAVKEAATSIS